MSTQWGLIFGDGSVRTGYNGPRARSYCEAEALRIGDHTGPVCRSTIIKGDWQEVDSRNRFRIKVFGEEGRAYEGHLQVLCSLCNYLTRPDRRVFAPVRAFEDHWYDKHVRDHLNPPPRKPWWKRWFS